MMTRVLWVVCLTLAGLIFSFGGLFVWETAYYGHRILELEAASLESRLQWAHTDAEVKEMYNALMPSDPQ